MDKKRLKKLMTKVAKGEISREAADKLIKPKKVAQKRRVQEIEGEEVHTELNTKEVKQSHKHI